MPARTTSEFNAWLLISRWASSALREIDLFTLPAELQER